MCLEDGATHTHTHTHREGEREPASVSVSAVHTPRGNKLSDLIADNTKFRAANGTASSTGRLGSATVVIAAIDRFLFPLGSRSRTRRARAERISPCDLAAFVRQLRRSRDGISRLRWPLLSIVLFSKRSRDLNRYKYQLGRNNYSWSERGGEVSWL